MTTTTVPAKFQPVLDAVGEYVRDHPGCTRSELVAMIRGGNAAISYAVTALIRDGSVLERAKRRLYPAGWFAAIERPTATPPPPTAPPPPTLV